MPPFQKTPRLIVVWALFINREKGHDRGEILKACRETSPNNCGMEISRRDPHKRNTLAATIKIERGSEEKLLRHRSNAKS